MVAPLGRRSGRKSSQVRSNIVFVSVNMRNCCQRNVRKHNEIKDSDEHVTLNMYEILKFSEKFDNLYKMETTSSESKVKMEGSGKWLVTALDLKTKVRSKIYIKRQVMPSEMSV